MRRKMIDLEIAALVIFADVMLMLLIYYVGKKPIDKVEKTEVENEG